MAVLLTAQEAAQLLRVQPHRIYALVRAGLLPGGVRLGRQIRLDAETLNDFIRSGGQALAGPGGWRRTNPGAGAGRDAAGR